MHRRLVYRGADADERHWDAHWASRLTSRDIRRPDPFVVKWTRKYLPAGSRVVDAGCGLANTVHGLSKAGYDAWGVDYATETVATVNRLAPELKVIEADVRKLPFEDSEFDGLWSLGVIEHFPDGYDAIVAEMTRVVKPGGLAFVTVPAMSPLRRMKTRLSAYPRFNGDYANFYQFVLSPDQVEADFAQAGWQRVAGAPRGGFKGLKDESGPFYPALQALYDLPWRPARWLRAGLNRVLAPLSYHTRLFVFRNLKSPA